MPDLVVRPANEADLVTFARVWIDAVAARAVEGQKHATLDQATMESIVAKQFAADGAFPLALCEGDLVVATSSALPARADDGASPAVVPGLAHISLISVIPQRWGMGHGRTIVVATLIEARRRGFVRAQLWTQESNVRAQQLYDSLGFIRSGRIKADESGDPVGHWVNTDLSAAGQ